MNRVEIEEKYFLLSGSGQWKKETKLFEIALRDAIQSDLGNLFCSYKSWERKFKFNYQASELFGIPLNCVLLVHVNIRIVFVLMLNRFHAIVANYLTIAEN